MRYAVCYLFDREFHKLLHPCIANEYLGFALVLSIRSIRYLNKYHANGLMENILEIIQKHSSFSQNHRKDTFLPQHT